MKGKISLLQNVTLVACSQHILSARYHSDAATEIQRDIGSVTLIMDVDLWGRLFETKSLVYLLRNRTFTSPIVAFSQLAKKKHFNECTSSIYFMMKHAFYQSIHALIVRRDSDHSMDFSILGLHLTVYFFLYFITNLPKPDF